MYNTECQIEIRLKKAIKLKNLSIKEVATKIDMTEAGLHYAFKNKTLKFHTIEKILTVLGIDWRFILNPEFSEILKLKFYTESQKENIKRIKRLEKSRESLFNKFDAYDKIIFLIINSLIKKNHSVCDSILFNLKTSEDFINLLKLTGIDPGILIPSYSNHKKKHI